MKTLPILIRELLVCLLPVFFIHTTGAQDSWELYTIVDYPGTPESIVIDKKVTETSGLIYFSEGYWTINDSGNKPEIYKLDPASGDVMQIVRINNADNNDWEELTQDDKYLYVGDFGNNKGTRTDLKILRIDKNLLEGSKNRTVDADQIRFSYSDQSTFEPSGKHNFDCEAMISYNDSLWLFTKNRGNLKTNVYKVPKEPGTYNLEPAGSFDVDGLITGAFYNKIEQKLLLIGYKNYIPFIFVFENYKGSFNGVENVVRFNFRKLGDTQTEGICMPGEHEVVISSEQTKQHSQSLYKYNLKKIYEQSGLEWK